MPGAPREKDRRGRDFVLRRARRTAGGSRGPRQLRRTPHPLRSRCRISLPQSSASATSLFRLISTGLTASADRERYQTIYAREKGSVAAPTAGLHFTPEILAEIKARGIETAEVTLHVGLGTFQPVREERVEDHKLHRESYSISPSAAAAINRALDSGRRIVAIGNHHRQDAGIFCRGNRDGSRPGAAKPISLSIPAMSSGWWARCSPISICRNPPCSCWCAPSRAGSVCSTHIAMPWPSATGSILTEIACFWSDRSQEYTGLAGVRLWEHKPYRSRFRSRILWPS